MLDPPAHPVMKRRKGEKEKRGRGEEERREGGRRRSTF
jgi:hypothetical protein